MSTIVSLSSYPNFLQWSTIDGNSKLKAEPPSNQSWSPIRCGGKKPGADADATTKSVKIVQSSIELNTLYCPVLTFTAPTYT